MSFDSSAILPLSDHAYPIAFVADICSVGDGAHSKVSRVAEGIPYLTSKNIGIGALKLDKFDRISVEDYDRLFPQKSKATRRPMVGDVLIGIIGTFGNAYLYNKFDNFGVASSIGILRPDQKKLNPKFLYYVITSSKFRETHSSHNAGSAQGYTNIAALKKLPVPLPPLRQQEQIAALLGALDERIALLRETNRNLEAMAQVLFKSWFVDFDPVHAKQEGRPPESIDEATAELFPDSFNQSSLGLVPQGWGVEKLENWLSALETGRRPKGGVAGILKGVPSIGAESIFRVGQYEYSKTKYVPEDFFCKMKSGVLQSHDVLLYKDGGKPGVFLPRVSMFGEGFPFERCGINEHVFRIRLKAPFNQPFLYFWLWSDAVMHELKHRGGKAAIPGINQSDVKEQKILVPDEAVLRRFDELVSPLISRILNNSKKAQSLVSVRDNLLPRLISGLLRLPDAAALMKQAA